MACLKKFGLADCNRVDKLILSILIMEISGFMLKLLLSEDNDQQYSVRFVPVLDACRPKPSKILNQSQNKWASVIKLIHFVC